MMDHSGDQDRVFEQFNSAKVLTLIRLSHIKVTCDTYWFGNIVLFIIAAATRTGLRRFFACPSGGKEARRI